MTGLDLVCSGLLCLLLSLTQELLGVDGGSCLLRWLISHFLPRRPWLCGISIVPDTPEPSPQQLKTGACIVSVSQPKLAGDTEALTPLPSLPSKSNNQALLQ